MRRRLLGLLIAGVLLASDGSARAEVEAFADTARIPKLTVPAGGSPLPVVLQDVQKLVAGFKYVVVRQPGATDPTVPAMDLSDVTLGQFLLLVSHQVRGVELQPIEVPGNPDKPPLFVILLESATRPVASTEPAINTPPKPEQHVDVVRLSDLVLPRALAKTDNGDHTREATDDVLSAVQAALDVAAMPGPPAVLRVHQPTLTLIARGTTDQLNLIENTLNTLRPTQDELEVRLQTEMRARTEAEAVAKQLRLQLSEMWSDKPKATTRNGL